MHNVAVRAKAKAAKEAREQEESLQKLMADIKAEKDRSAIQAKEAEDKLEQELEAQRTQLLHLEYLDCKT